MKIRFASWNVNNRKLIAPHLEIFRAVRPDVMALQECSAAFHDALAANDVFACGASSLELRPPRQVEGRSRRLGCSLFAARPLQITACSLVPRLAFPERTLVATVRSRGAILTVCSFHAPPGASWGSIKPRTLRTIARWLVAQPAPLVFGIDANCPKTDHPDIQKNEWWWDDEPLLLGESPLHKLRDVFRVHLANNPTELARVVAARPNGPLAVSHLRGNRRITTECRYDFVYATADVSVEKVVYMFDEIVRRLSDHAFVVADLVVTPPPSRTSRGRRS
jgi:endonuclease/exonuclease/phosphatase family metal-dependent hydrolase